jgi:hypothetical protein
VGRGGASMVIMAIYSCIGTTKRTISINRRRRSANLWTVFWHITVLARVWSFDLLCGRTAESALFKSYRGTATSLDATVSKAYIPWLGDGIQVIIALGARLLRDVQLVWRHVCSRNLYCLLSTGGILCSWMTGGISMHRKDARCLCSWSRLSCRLWERLHWRGRSLRTASCRFGKRTNIDWIMLKSDKEQRIICLFFFWRQNERWGNIHVHECM